MKKILWVPLLLAVLLTGCQPTAPKTISKSEKAMDIAYSPIVCKYSVHPGWGSVIDCISTNIQINDDNTVTIFYGDFWDPTDYVSLDYIYGETFEITEEQKQSIVTAILDVLPENALRDTDNKATEVLIQYLFDHYPEHYEWLKDSQ